MLVAGAGVVGMACARALQRAGYDVAVADPAAPGSGCSAGNAGIVATDHVLPLARPEVLRSVPRMVLRGSRSPLSLKLSRLPGLAPWMRHFAAACRAERVDRGITATAALTGGALAAWEEELRASGGCHLLCRRGLLALYFSEAAFRADELERRHQERLGVPWEVLSAEAVHGREPAVSSGVHCGVLLPAVAHVMDPQAVVSCLAEAFVREGGRLLEAALTGTRSESHQVRSRLSDRGIRSRYLVLAAGLESEPLVRSLGTRVPLAAEMGYHLAFDGVQGLLNAPVMAAEDGFIVTPMAGHLRVAGTVELAARETEPDWRRAAVLASRASRLFREPLPEPARRWRGSRPTLPDYLPAIGPLPGHPRIMAAFGHQHIGLTTAAVTGRLIRDLVRGESPGVDMAPYDPGRFTSPRA